MRHSGSIAALGVVLLLALASSEADAQKRIWFASSSGFLESVDLSGQDHRVHWWYPFGDGDIYPGRFDLDLARREVLVGISNGRLYSVFLRTATTFHDIVHEPHLWPNATVSPNGSRYGVAIHHEERRVYFLGDLPNYMGLDRYAVYRAFLDGSGEEQLYVAEDEWDFGAELVLDPAEGRWRASWSASIRRRARGACCRSSTRWSIRAGWRSCRCRSRRARRAVRSPRWRSAPCAAAPGAGRPPLRPSRR